MTATHRAPRTLRGLFLFSLLVVLSTSAGAAPSNKSRPLLAYWAFNCFTTCGDANFQPESIGQQPASMSWSFVPDDGVNESGTTLNAVANYEARSALTLRTGEGGINNGRDLTWRVSTAGMSMIEVSFAARRSGGGFSSNRFQYTADGVSYADVGGAFDPSSGGFTVVRFDLRQVRELNDNPNAGFRIVFNGGSASDATQFVLLDNLQVVGKSSKP